MAEETKRAEVARGPLAGRGTVVLDRLLGVWSSPASLGSGSVSLGVGPFSAGHSVAEVVSASGFRTQMKTTSLQIEPSLDVLVSDRVSVGGSASLAFLDSKQSYEGAGGTATSHARAQIGVAPRLGYVFPVSRTVAFWPRLSVAYGREWMRFAYSPASRQSAVGVGLDAGLVVGLTDHLLLMAGPRISVRHSWGDGGGAAYVVPADTVSSSGTSVQVTAYGSLGYAF